MTYRELRAASDDELIEAHEVAVEVAGLRGFGVHQRSAAANLPAHGGGAGDHVLQQGGAQPPAFVVLTHSQASQQGDRLGVASRSPAQSWRRGFYGRWRPCTTRSMRPPRYCWGDSSPFVKANFRSLGRRVRCFVATTEDEKNGGGKGGGVRGGGAVSCGQVDKCDAPPSDQVAGGRRRRLAV